MSRFTAITAVAFAVVLTPLVASAQYGSISRGSTNGVVSPTAASRLGLKRSWFTQVQLDRSRARVSHVRQYVSPSRFSTKHVVTWTDGKEVYTEESLDMYGDPLGVEGAEKAAKDRVQKLKDKDIQAELKTVMVPEVTLYVQTNRSTLQALDAATGRTKWVAQVGNRDYPSMAPGANDDYVGVVNGSTLYILDQESGKLAWERRLDQAPGAGPALTDEIIFVPTVTGKVEAYDVDNPRQPPWFYQATGRLLIQPTVATNSVSWPTDRGYLYVGNRDRTGVRFRLETRDAIAAHSTFLPPNKIFVGSLDGYAYCVHEFSGDIIWRFSAGDPISEPPTVTKDALYLIAEGAGMYRINPEDGIEQWWSPNIEKVLCASKDRVYCLARGNQFVVLDAQTGGRIDALNMRSLDLFHTNWQTDRIFVGTKTGVIQCLHEVGADWPTVHNVADPEDSARPQVKQIQEGDAPPAEGGVKPVDPFGGGADPFAGGADPFAGGADPFAGGGADPAPDGGAADPFGGGADPFGGGADPFGGGDAGGGDDAGGGADPFGGGAAEDPFG